MARRQTAAPAEGDDLSQLLFDESHDGRPGGGAAGGRPGGGAADERPGPSPAETDAIAWTAIDEASQRKRCAGARGLANFLRETAHAFKTKKGDESTNIIDQGERVTYALGRDHLLQLFKHLEACRAEGSGAHFSERQGTTAAPRSGLMLDFDIFVKERKPALTDRHYYRIATALTVALQRDVDFAAQLPAAAGGRKAAEVRFHVFFIVKPEGVPVATGKPSPEGAAGGDGSPLYRYGLHLLAPGLKLGRAYKKWLVRQFRGDPGVAATLRDLGAVGDPADCLDQNSASVPVLFFGSCKRGGTPYTLGAALEVTADVGADAGSGGWVPSPVIRRLGEADLRPYNLVAELGLVAEAEYETGAPPLVRKLEFEPRPEVAEKARDWGERSQGGVTPAEDLILAEHSLSTLTLHDAGARHLHALLDCLDESYYTDRARWRDVIFALANTSDQYKPLAVWFSQKCPGKWAAGGAAALDQMWDDAVARRGAVEHPLTLHSIRYWASTSNPERHAEVMARSYFTLMVGFVYDHGGKLQHYMVSKVLHAMLGSKFCVDVADGARGAKSYCWFEFVLPGQAMKAGEVWKWRQEVEPDDVHIYMSEKLTQVLGQISDHLHERQEAATEEAQAKYYKELSKQFAASRVNLFNDTFKNGVVRQANYLFRKRGFADELDRLPYLFGVGNGVLRLGARCALIDHYHEYPISRFTPVAFRRFDPSHPMTRVLLGAVEDIIPEADARDWILFHAAQGLSGGEKEGLLLLWEGGGQNGKTSFLRWVAKALGPYAAKFNIQLMACDREDADKPNSAMMRFKHLNYAYAEETNKATALNVARMKEMVNAGEVSGRELHGRQEEFTMHTNLVAASQYSFIVDTTDHGTWRRIRHFTAKRRFRKNPDPNNPLEKKDDQRFVRQYPNDPEFQSSMQSLLVHYYERLENEYNGELKNVPAPTIERETEAFRISQDALHRWICESIVVSPDCEVEHPLGVLGGYYTEWYSIHIERKRHVASDIIKAIESSALMKYLKPAPNRTQVLRGCRVLTAEDLHDTRGVSSQLRPGEEFFSEAEMRGAGARADAGADAGASAGAGAGAGADAGAGASTGAKKAWWEARTTPPSLSSSSSSLASSSSSRAPSRAPSLAASTLPAARGSRPDNVPREDILALELVELVDAADEDRAVLRAERVRLPPAQVAELDNADIDALLDTGSIPGAGRPGPGAYTLDDVYG